MTMSLLSKYEAVVYPCREDVVTQSTLWYVVSVAEHRGLLKFPGCIHFLGPKSQVLQFLNLNILTQHFHHQFFS